MSPTRLLLRVSFHARVPHRRVSPPPACLSSKEGAIATSKFENPHAQITVKASDKVWTVILAPTSRMTARGAPAAFIAVGKTVTAVGYLSKVDKDEIRAERITVDGKTVEMR